MDLYYFDSTAGNFGDDLNQWLWDELLPGWREALPGHVLVGVGTLISGRLPRGMPKLVLGAGVGYGVLPDAQQMAECIFLSVRGPRSAAALGLPSERGVVDPAVMLADLPAFRDIPKAGRPVFVPHHESLHLGDWAEVCRRAGYDYLPPDGDARDVICRLAAAPLVVTESMHGAIIADAFRTPWHAITLSPRILKSKWLDWAESLGVSLRMTSLFPLSHWLADKFPQRRKARVAVPPHVAAAPAEGLRRLSARQKLQRLLMRVEAEVAVWRLRRMRSRPGQLSDRLLLDAAKARYRVILDTALAHASS